MSHSVKRYTAKSHSRSKWSYKYKPKKKGAYNFRVIYSGSSIRPWCASNTLALSVK